MNEEQIRTFQGCCLGTLILFGVGATIAVVLFGISLL